MISRVRYACVAYATGTVTPDFYYINLVRKVPRRGPVQVMLHAPREARRGARATREDFSPVSGKVGHRGKIFPRAAGAAKTLRDHVLLVCRERLWGFRARR